MKSFRIYYKLSGVIEKNSRMATIQAPSFDEAIEVFGKKFGRFMNIVAIFKA